MNITGGEVFLIAIAALAWRTGCFLVEGCAGKVPFDYEDGLLGENGHALEVYGRSGKI